MNDILLPRKESLKIRAMGKSEEEIYEKMLGRSLDYLNESKWARIQHLEGSTPLILKDEEEENKSNSEQG